MVIVGSSQAEGGGGLQLFRRRDRRDVATPRETVLIHGSKVFEGSVWWCVGEKVVSVVHDGLDFKSVVGRILGTGTKDVADPSKAAHA